VTYSELVVVYVAWANHKEETMERRPRITNLVFMGQRLKDKSNHNENVYKT
jgi:hypothetical protein